MGKVKIRWPDSSPHWLITLLVTGYIVLMFNRGFFATVADIHHIDTGNDYFFMASVAVFIFVIINFLLSIFIFPWLTKPFLITLLLSAPFAAYFIDAYNIVIDSSMIENAMETDVDEALELFSSSLLGYAIMAGLLPAFLIARTTIGYGSVGKFVTAKVAILTLTIVTISMIAVPFYQDYASLFRNNRYVRDLIVPINYVYALQSYGKQFLPENIVRYQEIGTDAHLGPSYTQTRKRSVSVLIVGETARSASFSLYDYRRETTPLLAKQDIISFSQFSSCGTATAVSLPCMFSRLNRDNYKKSIATSSDNLLDVLQRSGLKVVWLDNNSGCKGVCDRLTLDIQEAIEVPPEDASLCLSGECYDMILFNKLARTIASSDEDMVIVLHQQGSHGPAYYLRTPDAFKKFIPFCKTNQLQECTQPEIINAYDSTILYTDYLIASVIDYLKSEKNNFDASLVYVSDHGESLGENNIYLHGLPYILAPVEQTHVPFIVWLSDGVRERQGISAECLRNKRQYAFSHDNLFDSMLGLLDVKTSVYQPDNDLFGNCHTLSNTQLARETTR